MADAAPPSPVMLLPSDSDLLRTTDRPEAARPQPYGHPPHGIRTPSPPPPASRKHFCRRPLHAAVDDGETTDQRPWRRQKHMTSRPGPPTKKSKKKAASCVQTSPHKEERNQPSPRRLGRLAPMRPPEPSCGEDEFLLTPTPRLAAEHNDDGPEHHVLLSRVYKSEKIEVSEDRLTAGSTKGYRMIRATHGVASGAWYFEVKLVHLGSSGATRLGWATNKADMQTPVGCDSFGFRYRSVDGSKVYKAWRDEYAGEGYGEGDTLGFYISLPQGELYEPKQPDLVKHKGMPFHAQGLKDEKKTPDPVPGA
ncbi:hypothetical protein ZWY2020_044248 [Hordeum vulgare]|nr:hypothetical protein ZWY2020_044248 [Hordeum vulgare]